MSNLREAAERFAKEASMFREWSHSDIGSDGVAVRGALLMITRLYLAALELPLLENEEVGEDSAERVSDEEWNVVLQAAGRLPFDFYGDVHDPHTVPPEEPSIGSLSDDIADIYRHVVTGLREHEDGRHSEALWEWSFFFRHHWGDHATGALRALHAWLRTNAVEHLSADSKSSDVDRGGEPREPGE